jgi:cytochrome P450
MAVVKVPITREIRGHKAVRDALRNTAEYSSDLQGDADVRDYRQLPLEVDPPRHHLYRAALTPYFVKPAVERHIEEFEANSSKAISNFFAQGEGEVVSELALPLVMQNLGILYGRSQEVEEWISWGPDVWTAAGPTRSGEVLHTYLDRVYAEAIEGRTEDIWKKIAHLRIEEKEISKTEFMGIAGVMLAGGRDTVVKLLTGMMWHFAERPSDFELLRENPDLIDGAIQEFLRFLTPLPAMARTTTPESSTKELPDDRYVQISFLSGNFDESVFDNPYVIDIKRPRNPHLSFGFGPHTCLGNHVAEIEAKAFLLALIEMGSPWTVLEDSEIKYFASPLDRVPDQFASLRVAISRS